MLVVGFLCALCTIVGVALIGSARSYLELALGMLAVAIVATSLSFLGRDDNDSV